MKKGYKRLKCWPILKHLSHAWLSDKFSNTASEINRKVLLADVQGTKADLYVYLTYFYIEESNQQDVQQ
jgi:hypothetical protein